MVGGGVCKTVCRNFASFCLYCGEWLAQSVMVNTQIKVGEANENSVLTLNPSQIFVFAGE